MNQLILSFGGNIGDVPGIFEKALVMLIEALHGDLLKKSSLYKTEPLYDRAQPWFWNMAAILETPVTATDALNICLETENHLGRTRDKRRYGPRQIDIDLIFFNDLLMDSPKLVIPHPRFAERKFVLLPISEIAVNYIVPGYGQTVGELLQQCPDKSSVEKIE